MTRIYVTRKLPVETSFEAIGEDVMPPSRDRLLELIAGADGVLCMLTEKIDAAVMDAAPNLKVISNMAVGYDNIDIAAATARGIPVGNTPGILTETTADLAWALMMAAARRLPEGQRYVQAGKWQTWMPELLLGRDLYGATLGILGMGRIGAAVARRASGFNMRVIYHRGNAQSIDAEAVSFHELLKQSDFLSLHMPLTPQTHHMIGAAELNMMKPTAILVNTARGGVVDPVALYAALRQGVIWGAALDVTEPEPIHVNDPLLTLDNCLIVPHLGSSSVDTRQRMARLAIENLQAGLKGERLPHVVNPEVYERS